MGFLRVVNYPKWLTNAVPVSKKDGKVRMCVDFRDLNKANLKDDFLLPYNDFGLLQQTSFITLWGTYCYNVMPFGLKNAGATYQRAVINLLHDLIHKKVEVYVDNMIVKSKDYEVYISALQKLFQQIPFYKLRLNPKKCTFGVMSGKLLGFMVS